MQQNGNLVRQIQELLAARFHAGSVDPEVDLLDSGLVDSVSLVELVMELERRFGIHLPFEELQIDDFRNVRRIADLVNRTAP
ncbi:MAG TPA: acyl carrier protein [bacterium]|nr:acyl carrier protein [bacterium]